MKTRRQNKGYTLNINGIKHNDTQHNDFEHDSIDCYGECCYARYLNFFIVKLSVIIRLC
jgi:hypothetical protein